MSKQHHYQVNLTWTGNAGTGTSHYKAYERSHTISAHQKAEVLASSDPAFRGDPTKYNPEELLVSSLASCHMLWFLHLCAESGVVVVDYMDHATGIMKETPDGSGHFTSVTLNPQVTVTEANMVDKANALHQKANKYCFVANSVNFPVHHIPVCKVKEQ